MEAHVRSATQALLKLVWGLLLVQAVAMVRLMHLTTCLSVHVTLGIQEKTETAHSVTLALIKQTWGLLIALFVQQTLSPRLVASHPQTVFAQEAFICQTMALSAKAVL